MHPSTRVRRTKSRVAMHLATAARIASVGLISAACTSAEVTSGQQTPEPRPTGSGGHGSVLPNIGSGGAGGSAGSSGSRGGAAGPVDAASTDDASGARPSSRDASPDADGSGLSDGDGAPPTGGALIPQITVSCPAWQSGVVTFMGLDGIRIEVGARSNASLVPMLVYWHSTGSASDDYTARAAPVATGVTSAGGVIVSFQGTTGGDLYSGTNIFGEGDLVLVDQLVACAVRDRHVDPRRIYTMGCSAGGFFATATAALRSQYIAAVVSGSGGEVIDAPFANTHTPALMTIHPSPGYTQPVDVALTSTKADTAFTARGGFVVDCQTAGGVCDPSLNGDAWTFLEAHPFGVVPEPWANGLPEGFASECTIR